jgi:hypothetical protein
MSKARKFDDILNECIERMLKGEPIETCLAAFPEHAAELEPLLRTAMATRKAADIQPRAEFRQRAAHEFQAAVRNLKPRRSSSLRWQLRLVTAISVVVIVLMAGTGTVAAATNSLPDQPLYGVKLFTENVRVALTPSAVGKAELYAQFTDTRVSEIIKMADEGKVAEVEKATERMNSNLTAITRLTQSAGDTGTAGGTPPVLSSASAAAEAPPSTPTTMPVPTPTTISVPTPTTMSVPTPTIILVPTPAPITTTAAAPNVTTPQTLPKSVVPPPSVPMPVPGVPSQAPSFAQKVTPVPAPTPQKATSVNATRLAGTQKAENTAKNNEKPDLQTTVSQQAQKNTQDLEEALKRVPDNVKPSLQKAIDVAGKGYEEALKNMDKKR